MLRRQARERRQYVYAKSVEAQERQTYERKQQLKDALATGKSLPTELKKDARKLGQELQFDEAQTGKSTHTSRTENIYKQTYRAKCRKLNLKSPRSFALSALRRSPRTSCGHRVIVE